MNWISVKDRLPEEYKKIFLIEASGNIYKAIRINKIKVRDFEGEVYLDDIIWETDEGDRWENHEKCFTHWIYVEDIPKLDLCRRYIQAGITCLYCTD